MEPFVSVVCLTTQEYPEKVMECMQNQTYKNWELILAKEKGIVNAMNKALARAKGEIFVRIDDDVEMPTRWLEELIRPFSNSEVCGATGPTLVPRELRANRDSIRWAENPKGLLRWLYDDNEFNPAGIRESGCVSYDSNYQERFGLALCINFDHPEIKWRDRHPDHLEGTNWAMRTELIRKVGGFDPKFDGVAEWFDDDVLFKIKKFGYYLSYNPAAYLFHNLGKGNHFAERFEGLGRIKNFLRFHWRHARWRFLKLKFYVYLIIWSGYFFSLPFRIKK